MPVLDADALKTDPAGMAFLRAVLQSRPEDDRSADAGCDPLQRFRLASQSQCNGVSQPSIRRARAKVGL